MSRFISYEPALGPIESLDLTGIHWVIVGGESGSHARPMNQAWARDLIARCDLAKVPVFFKQAGAVLARQLAMVDKKGSDFAELPPSLQRREWPRVNANGA